jgi:hypothetical protein
VDFYSSPKAGMAMRQTTDVIPYTFTKRESVQYRLNGKNSWSRRAVLHACPRHFEGTTFLPGPTVAT